MAHLVMTPLIASLIEFSDAQGLGPNRWKGLWKHISALEVHAHAQHLLFKSLVLFLHLKSSAFCLAALTESVGF